MQVDQLALETRCIIGSPKFFDIISEPISSQTTEVAIVDNFIFHLSLQAAQADRDTISFDTRNASIGLPGAARILFQDFASIEFEAHATPNRKIALQLKELTPHTNRAGYERRVPHTVDFAPIPAAVLIVPPKLPQTITLVPGQNLMIRGPHLALADQRQVIFLVRLRNHFPIHE